MADQQQVVEYCFSAEPGWACDAIECTRTGVEFNFEKLCLLCKTGQLPDKITIYLEAAAAAAGGAGEPLRVAQVSRSEGGAGGGSAQTSIANEMRGAKVNGGSTAAGSASSSGRATSAAPANETFLEKEIRIAKDRDEMLRQEKLQRDSKTTGIRQPEADGSLRDAPDSGSAASRPSSASASKAAAGATTTLRAAAVASASPSSGGGGGSGGTLAATSVTASAKLFKSSEFTRSPNYKYEDPVQQDVRIALLREEEMRQQRASGALPRQQQQAAAEPRSDAPAAASAATKASASAANGMAPEKGSSPSSSSSSPSRRDIVIVESASSTASEKEAATAAKGQIFGLTVAPATPAASKIEAEIREQMAREAAYKRSTAN